jgi:hypothetical protein
MRKMNAIGAALIGAALLCSVPVSLHQSKDKGLSVSLDKADARVGRPATPGSVAGVARRTTRRTMRHCAAGVCY